MKRNGQPGLQLLTLYLTLTHIFLGRKAKINLHTTPKLTVVIPISWGRGGGVHVNLTKKNSDRVVCFCFFLFS